MVFAVYLFYYVVYFSLFIDQEGGTQNPHISPAHHFFLCPYSVSIQ